MGSGKCKVSKLDKRLLLTALALLFVGSMAVPRLALAHSRLQKSSPSAGAVLEQSPNEIDLSFSEPVALEFSRITIFDRTRHEQAAGPLEQGAEGDTSLRAPVQAKLLPGTYAVVWRVVSAVDGHLASGSFSFSVRAPGDSTGATPGPISSNTGYASGAAGAPLEGSGDSPDAARWLLRAVIVACIIVALGGSIFTLLVTEPAAAERGPEGELLWLVLGRRFARIGAYAAAILVVALAVDLLLQVAVIAQKDVGGSLARADLARLLVSTTRYGFAWSMKVLAGVALFGLFLYIWVRSRRGGAGLWEVGIAAGSLFLLAESLSSHAAAAQGNRVVTLPLPVISDWLHLVTAATWIGGLVYITAVLFPTFRSLGFGPEERRAFLGRSVPRFSKLALLSVLVLGVSGTYNLAVHTTDIGAIVSSLYGQIILVKVGLFIALIGLGAVNLVRLSPQFTARSVAESIIPGAPSKLFGTIPVFRHNVRLEVALMAVVLVCAGGLTLLPPPGNASAGYVSTASKSARSWPTSAATPDAHNPTAAATSVAGYSLVFTTQPSDAGDLLELAVNRAVSTTSPLTDVTKVLFVVTPQNLDSGGTVQTAALQGQAGPNSQIWSVTAPVFSVEGTYRITAVVQRNGPKDLKSAYLLTVSGTNKVSATAIEYVDLRFNTEPDPPVVGKTQATIELRNAEGEPITGATLFVTLSRPTVSGTGAPIQALPVAAKNGFYTVNLDFSAAGDWLLSFDVGRAGQPNWKSTASLEVMRTED